MNYGWKHTSAVSYEHTHTPMTEVETQSGKLWESEGSTQLQTLKRSTAFYKQQSIYFSEVSVSEVEEVLD